MTEGREPARRAAVHPLMHVAAVAAFALVITTLTLVMIPLAGTTPPWWDWFEAHSLTLFAWQVAVCLLAGFLGMMLDGPRTSNQPKSATPEPANLASAGLDSTGTAPATALPEVTGPSLSAPASIPAERPGATPPATT
ncbi:MAG: hypothetical protein ACKOFW_03060 [Planctomycetaceae bacterium]